MVLARYKKIGDRGVDFAGQGHQDFGVCGVLICNIHLTEAFGSSIGVGENVEAVIFQWQLMIQIGFWIAPKQPGSVAEAMRPPKIHPQKITIEMSFLFMAS